MSLPLPLEAGSSPLTRGKRNGRDGGSRRTGLIPAHAGKTARSRRTWSWTWAHPRSRGENEREELTRQLHPGSSPLTRGKRPIRAVQLSCSGLIPAHAGKTRRPWPRPSTGGAHPRSRGENLPPGAGIEGRAGSSPLTRGKHSAPARGVQALRLIPAHAGKTSPRRWGGRRSPAHPRSRGENAGLPVTCSRWRGSSPLTRGKRPDGGVGVPAERLIPAHAGKTAPPRPRPSSPGAHPRSRGENSVTALRYSTWPGSSPLTRGKHRVLLGDLEEAGLIPAHAGKTSTCGRRSTSWTAHPRSRGENLKQIARDVNKSGSSPLTRGKPHRQRTVHPRERLIPAHAGKTSRPRLRSRRPRAHPRSRGENSNVVRVAHNAQGSSPLTRGKQRQAAVFQGRGRLIPAHAGKTRTRTSSISASRAHPRSRGENWLIASTQIVRPGSSPLTRGKPARAAAIGPLLGLIPAHAGKTLPDLRFYRADRSDLGKP